VHALLLLLLLLLVLELPPLPLRSLARLLTPTTAATAVASTSSSIAGGVNDAAGANTPRVKVIVKLRVGLVERCRQQEGARACLP